MLPPPARTIACLLPTTRRASTVGAVVKPPRALPRGRARPPSDADDPALPVVALVGRPNVGKSALFNALTRRPARASLVRDTPAGHVTRDWTRGQALLGGLSFAALDTAGLEPTAAGGSLAAAAMDATAAALRTADAAVLLLDAREGIIPADAALAAWLRTHAPPNLPIIPALAKADGVGGAALAAAAGEGAGLGFGVPLPLSSTSGSGLADLAAALAPLVDAATERRRERLDVEADANADDDQLGPIRIALVGAPNVGKSTLANALLGRPRCLASPVPGTTRDAVINGVAWGGRHVELIDTAGWDGAVARRGAPAFSPRAAVGSTPAVIDEGDILASALAQTRRWLNLAHVVVVVVDAAAAHERRARGDGAAAASLTKAEIQLLGAAATAGRAAVLVANKADLVPDARAAAASLAAAAAARVPTLGATRAVALSATTGVGVDALLPAVAATHAAWATRLRTAALNRWVRSIQPPPSARPRGSSVPAQLARVTYITQTSARPPSFVAFVKGEAASVSDAARRALANALRREFGLEDVPVRVAVRGKK